MTDGKPVEQVYKSQIQNAVNDAANLDRNPERPENLSEDLPEGADAIASFIFGNPNMRRKVYRLAQDKKFPVFRMGSKICARRSTLLRWIEAQEKHLDRP